MIIHEVDTRMRLVVLSKGEEVIAGLTRLAEEKEWLTAWFTAIGGFRSVTLGYFESERRTYTENTWDEQVEACSVIGNISRFEGKLKVHAHAVIGTQSGGAFGGHLLRAQVWPTLEVLLGVSPFALERTQDPETGLALFGAGRKTVDAPGTSSSDSGRP